ncbi:hypothetical protein RMN57_34415 [Kitasatospora sp. CM 4170]|uniref:Secreted protein n=1 Tax=Kitasatospora aburaviensis TaxID=67265 RepID=A0ABW1F1N9_9ACTN|nr:hypothetical protein [Kitasatospora sp. CM 4170]WNM49428.1 hypothetical protein RMN57_34415 [Kitasatospora sp. CM 4170]
MKHRIRTWLATAGLLCAATLTVTSLAAADSPDTDASAAPPAVEDFAYPGAAAVTNVKLKRGDGHIAPADCAGTTQIQLWTRAAGNPDNKICFTVTGSTGDLTLELADVFAVQTNGRALRATVTADGAGQSVDVASGGFQGLGEGLDASPATAVELRITG